MKVTAVSFTSANTLVAKIISVFTKGGPSHVIMHLDTEAGEMIFHSTHGGVRLDSPSVWQARAKHRMLAHYQLTKPIEGGSLNLVMDQYLGSPYGFVELLGHGLARLVRLVTFGKYRAGNPWGRNTVCSELVWLVFKDHLISLRKYDRDMVSPQDLLVEMDAYESKFRLIKDYSITGLIE